MNEEIQKINDLLKSGWGNDAESQKEYMQNLAIWKARINELKAEAEEKYLTKLKKFADSNSSLKAHVYRDVRDAYLAPELAEKEKLDRISSTITAQMDGLKSILFLAGQEIRTLNLIIKGEIDQELPL